MTQLREQQESEARIVITTSDAGKKPKPAISTVCWIEGYVFMECFFYEINTGRTNYQNLLPMTFGGI